jgi:hypothetical protein
MLSTLSLTFSLPLRPGEIPLWRGAVAEAAGWEQDLFHNHLPPEDGEGGYHYRYPLIQYRASRGRAALFAVGEGCPALRRWLLESPGELLIAGQRRPLLVEQMREQRWELGLAPAPRAYRLRGYLPFHDENYRRWRESPGLLAQVQLLEGILAGHLLGFCEAMGCRLPARFDLRILHLDPPRPLRIHGGSRVAFDLAFEASLLLPLGIGLGKGISHGYGLLLPFKDAPAP